LLILQSMLIHDDTAALAAKRFQENTMTERASSTLPREAKGPVGPAPSLTGTLKVVADQVAAWPSVKATVHWRFDAPEVVDGIDFYVGDEELGHIHLDGSIHLATTSRLRDELVSEGLGEPFRWGRGWTLASVDRLGVENAIAVFRRNYNRLAR
jgi:hypothetical protein